MTIISAWHACLRKKAVCLFLISLALLFPAASSGNQADWARFKQRFVDTSGRIMDAGQGNISHSEGQGVAMLLAAHHSDQATFELIWQWTRQHLQVRDDHLLVWRWAPETGISDKNNASDGDLLVAWALLRAYDQWHAPKYLEACRQIAHDIRGKLLRQTPHGLILLPGAEGFKKAEGITINLSYWVFPALNEIGRADPASEWESLTSTGLAILRYARFGRWGLPPDWLLLNEKVVPSGNFPERFGYNAVRIPLYLLWARLESKSLLKPYQDFWGYFDGSKFLPAWTNLRDDSVDSYDASAGIHNLAKWVIDFPLWSSSPNYQLEWHAGDAKEEGYYSTVLTMLTEMAINERTAP